MTGDVDWPAWAAALGGVASAVAAFLAWKTSRSALSIARMSEERAQSDALSASRDRYSLLVTDIRMKKALLAAVSRDIEDTIAERLSNGVNVEHPKIKNLVADIKSNQRIIESAESILDMVKIKEPELRTNEQFVEENRGLSAMQLSITAAVDRLADIKTRSTQKL